MQYIFDFLRIQQFHVMNAHTKVWFEIPNEFMRDVHGNREGSEQKF